MKTFTQIAPVLLLFVAGSFLSPVRGQSILDPSDPIVTYNAASPPASPAWGTIGKWVRTKRVSWNTNNYKCYVYNGLPFRLRFPKSYNPTANDGKKYPMLIFFHGNGEGGPVTDNEYQLFHGGQLFDQAVTNDKFDGYLFYMQSNGGGWGEPAYQYIRDIINYMVTNNKLDIFRITANGLSAGGAGTWDWAINYTTYCAGSVPMSAASLAYLQTAPANLKFIPTWQMQGGLDGSPDPSTSIQIVNAMNAVGANLKYQVFPNDAHNTWDDTWAQPDFWPFMNRAYSSNPWPLFGRSQFCPGDPVNITVGVTQGYQAYQWRKDSVLINGATGNTIPVTQFGKYDCRVQKNGIWSDWSRIPLVVSIKTPTVSPTITIPPLVSNVLPAPDTSHGVTLQVPAGYASYQWQQVGNGATLSTTNTYNTTTPGQYQVKVTEQFGCSSNFSAPYTVINANGANKPSPAAALTITTTSQTVLRLDWSVNPSQQFPQTGFEVYQATQSGGPYTLIGLLGANAVTTTATGLNPGGKYYYIVRAVNGNAAAAASNVASGTTASDVQPPTAPTNLVVTGTTRSAVALSWGAAADNVGVTQYDVYVNGVKAYSTINRTFTVFDLQNAKSYTFAVTARDFAKNISPFSNQVSAVPIATGLTYKYYNFEVAPTNLPNYATVTPDATGISTSSTSLTPRTQNTNYGFLWEGFLHVTRAGTYQLRTVSVDGSKVYLGTLNGTGSPYEFAATAKVSNDGVHSSRTVTSSNTTLQVGVYPIAIAYFHGANGNGAITLSWKTPSSGNSFSTIPNSAFADAAVVNGVAPAAPSGLVATSVSSSKLGLAWVDNSNNETAFEIWRSLSATTGFTTVGIAPSGATGYTDSLLNAATRYYYQIRAIGQYGQSAFASGSQSNAVTQALPAVPAAPTALVARGMSTASSVTVRWTDNAANESSFQVYRSSNNNSSYLPLVSLPANTVSYADTGLFANAVYYYKVQAVNQGGSSAYSNEDSAHTADHLPVLTQITAGQFMRYGTTLSLNVQATDVDIETLTIQVNNLPAFGSFTPVSNGTGTILFNPGSTDQGVYTNISVRVTDQHGGSVTQPFTLTVNDNFNPVIARPVSNVVLNAKTTATVNLGATDPNGADVLSWSFTGLPGFVTPVTGGGSASLALAPGYADGGSYVVRVRVDDGRNGFDSLSFTITVVPVALPSTKTYIHFSDGSVGTVGGLPWNNTAAAPVQNLGFTNLKDQSGAVSGIRLTITSPWQNISLPNGTNTYGVNTGNNSGIYPDAVLGSAYYTDGAVQTFRVAGLDTSTKYSFTFLGSRGGVSDDRTTIYTVTGSAGSASVSLQCANNSTNTVSVNNVRPNADSTLTITLQKGPGAPYGYINALVIEKQFNDHTAPAKARDISGQFVNGNHVTLSWTAAAYNANGYQVYRSAVLTGPYTLLNPGAANPTQSIYNDSSINQNNTFYYYVTASNAYGVSPSSDTLTFTIPNLAPVVNAVGAISAQATKTKTVAVTASDPGDVITLQAVGLPSFAQFHDNGNGSGSLVLNPATADIGNYNGATLRATDDHGAVSSTPLSIAVSFVNLRNVYINFNDGSVAQPAQGVPWNNMNSAPNTGATIANLKDDSATSTGFGIRLVDAWTGSNNVGPVTGNNSGVYPDNVLQSLYYDGSGAPRHINITGLSSKGKYNVLFYSGRAGVSDNRITAYTIGGQTVSLNGASNTSQTAQINNISPDGSGNISIAAMQDPGAAFTYINAIQLQYSFDTTFYAPSSLLATGLTTNTIRLNWLNNTPGSVTGFEVWRSTSPTTGFSLLTTVGGTTTTYTDGGLTAGGAFFYEVRAVAGTRRSAFSNIAGGSTVAYTVEVQFNDGSQIQAQGGVWNSINTLLYPGYELPNMIDTKSQGTGMTMGIVTNFTGFNVFGTTTGNNSGVYPDNVMQGFYYCNFLDTARLYITNLNLTSTYNFNFFGSRVDPPTSVISTYQIGNQIVTQDAANNTTRVTQIAGVKPDSTGTIYFLVYNTNGGRAYLDALTIDGVPSAYSMIAQTPVATQQVRVNGRVGAAASFADSVAADLLAGETKVRVFPNPFVDGVTLSLQLPKAVSRLSVMLLDMSGKVIRRQELEGIPAGGSTQQLSLGRNLAPGSYFILLQGLPDGKIKAIQLLKTTK
jgi:hypothetical protein